MKKIFQNSMIMSITFILAGSTLFAQEEKANDDWSFGIGPTLFLLNIDGDVGQNTPIGPAKLSLDLDTSDILDILEKTLVFEGYATYGDWKFQGAFAYMELEENFNGELVQGNIPISADVNFKSTMAEFSAGYAVFKHEYLIVHPYIGGRWTEHRVTEKIHVKGPSKSHSIYAHIKEEWVDARAGLQLESPFAEKWTWDGSGEVGYGGSEGTYQFDTGVKWMFAKHMALRIYGQYTFVDFENDSPGDNDWYKYEVDEYGLGINLLFTF